MKNSQPIVNVDLKVDTVVAKCVFEALQHEVELQFESATRDESMNEHAKRTKEDRSTLLSEALHMKEQAVQKFKSNSRSKESLSLLMWATGELET